MLATAGPNGDPLDKLSDFFFFLLQQNTQERKIN